MSKTPIIFQVRVPRPELPSACPRGTRSKGRQGIVKTDGRTDKQTSTEHRDIYSGTVDLKNSVDLQEIFKRHSRKIFVRDHAHNDTQRNRSTNMYFFIRNIEEGNWSFIPHHESIIQGQKHRRIMLENQTTNMNLLSTDFSFMGQIHVYKRIQCVESQQTDGWTDRQAVKIPYTDLSVRIVKIWLGIAQKYYVHQTCLANLGWICFRDTTCLQHFSVYIKMGDD